ncbi:MAG: glycosyltransferase family 2 protein [Verrucomicrobiota bacterium]|jgi:glycosyltransferase involved in cell wall biosynthesis
MDISILISTHNRADSLARTLDSLKGVVIPDRARAEILVLDNASTDHTRAVAQSGPLGGYLLRYLYEPAPGKMRAQNLGLSAARGTILLTTDDDVIPSRDWLVHMTEPLRKGDLDGVVGRIELAADLLRPWMTSMHKYWLAAPEPAVVGRLELIGASMAFHRRVLDRVPLFDPELGPGALGFGDDGLFSWQLEEAGFRIGYAPEALVTHHPDASRLSRASWLSAARARGRSEAYQLYHWLHGDIKCARLRRWCLGAKLAARRRVTGMASEGAPLWELSYVLHMEKCRQFQIECGRPRNYAKRGLRRL